MDINITQDIRKFKTKDIGNFSFKEAGFIVIAVGVGYVAFRMLGTLDGAIIPAIVPLAFGFFKPMGMSLWTFLRTVGKELVTPKVYINETDHVYEPDEFEKLYGEEIAIPPSWNEVIQTNDNSTVVKIDKTERERYAV